MPTLAFDTSTPTGVVALLRGDGQVHQRSGPSQSKHGETLIPMIEEVLGEADVRVADLRLVAVGTGPGSFTGLRIGLATARGLGLARAVPVTGVSSLGVMAQRVAAEGAGLPVAAVVDAYRGEVYVALYGADGGEADGAPLLPPFNAAPADAGEALQRALGGGPVTLVGDGARKYTAELSSVLGDQLRLAPQGLDTVCPVTLARVARGLLDAGGVDSLQPPEPAYVRGADAKLPDVPLKL